MEKETSMENKLELNRRPAQESDTEFARQAHHKAYHDVVVKKGDDPFSSQFRSDIFKQTPRSLDRLLYYSIIQQDLLISK